MTRFKQISRSRWLIAALITLSLVSQAATAHAVEPPRIGLVLSGGGARGAAHVGVIKVLEQLRVPIDCIAGTSIGAIAGGLLASGLDAARLQQVIVDADWTTLLTDRPPRSERFFRRKSEDLGFLVNLDIGLGKQGLILPPGLIQGQSFAMALRRHLLPVATITDFDALPIPFRAVATDISNAEPVVLHSGNLAQALRASASVPALFTPVQIGGRKLVDGGIANNLPVDIARQMCADTLIVVDVGYPLAQSDELGSAISISSRILNAMIQRQTRKQQRLLRNSDIVIRPALGEMGSQAFDQSVRAMRRGEDAARKMASQLNRLSLSEEDYARYRAHLQSKRAAVPVIDTVTMDNQSGYSDQVLWTRLSEHRGKPLNVDRLEAELAQVFSMDAFEAVDYAITARPTGNELSIRARSKSWGPNYLRLGVNLEDDFRGTSSYNLAARLTMTELNRLGGEFRVGAVIGDNPSLDAEFYQPLDNRSRWFITPKIRYEQSSVGLFEQGQEFQRLRNNQSEFSLTAGRHLGQWGVLQAGLGRSFSHSSVQVGQPGLAGNNTHLTTAALQFSHDTIDRFAIPRFGTFFNFVWVAARQGYGAKQDLDILDLNLLRPMTWGNHTLMHWWELSSGLNENNLPTQLNSLGGLFNLSGYSRDELQGKHKLIGRLLYYWRLGGASVPIISTPIYLGASLEVGNVWQRTGDISARSAVYAGSVSMMIDSVIGPVYLAYGVARGGRRSAYLFLGQTF